MELALCLPLLVFLLLATVEACNLIFLQQSITIAAYEGARTALVPGATEGNARAQVQQVLSDREVLGATITITPDNFATAELGDFITVQIDVDYNPNRLVPIWGFSNRRLQSSVAMMCEQ
jgi:hypothetical protein